ncbi:MAG TPA: heme exporter protein CcmB [Steroidobacteraceae bacterium]|nr:heme exporter protein CcmB [Steroidobacteraceae bacterium]
MQLALRRWDQVLQPLLFFVMVSMLFPMATSATPAELRLIGTGVVWVAAMLASLLSLESLFRPDVEDGTMEQWVLSGQPLAWLLMVKMVAHWVLTGVPLVVFSPLMATGFGIPNEVLPVVMASLALGTGVLAALGAIGAALTVSVRRGQVLVALLVLPLQVPVLVFGAYAADLAMRGEPVSGPMYLLASMLLASLCLAPFALAAAIRIGVES